MLRNIEEFKNTEKGPCVIVGSAPSVNKIPNKFFSKFKTIGVNRSHLRLIPDYHCTIDIKPWIVEAKEVMSSNNVPYFISPHWAEHDLKKIKINGSNEIFIPLINKSEKDRYLETIKNPTLIEQGVTSIFGVVFELAIPLAFYLGFERIYLAGVDYNTSKGLYFHNDPEDQKIYEKLKKNIKMNPFEDRVHLIERIKETDKCDRIFNLSESTNISCFQKINWKDALKKEQKWEKF
jgi:hypothetical protein